MNQDHRFMDRRSFLNVTGAGGLALFAATVTGSRIQPAMAATLTTTPDAALSRLLAGNQRFIEQKSLHPDQSPARLKEVAQGQHPYATILSCADSRVPPEILFDEGIGDIFDIRVAGNIITPEVLGSIEYAVALLNCPLVMVLGHERCGAVTAAVEGEALPGQIGSFVKAITPAIPSNNKESPNPVDNAVIANVQYQLEKLKQDSTIVSQRLQENALKVVGARYDLDTGTVTLI